MCGRRYNKIAEEASEITEILHTFKYDERPLNINQSTQAFTHAF